MFFPSRDSRRTLASNSVTVNMPLPHCQHLDTKLRRKGWSRVRVRKVPAGDDNLIDGVTKRGVSLGVAERFGHEQTPWALASDGPEGSISRIGKSAPHY